MKQIKITEWQDGFKTTSEKYYECIHCGKAYRSKYFGEKHEKNCPIKLKESNNK